MTGRARIIGIALTVIFLGLVACSPPSGQKQAQLMPTPKPGEVGYDPDPCGGDHGMLGQLSDDDRGRVRLGPPQMSICP